MKIKPTPQYFAFLAIVLFVASWMASGITAALLRPSIDQNVQAYIILVDAINQSYYSQMESQARHAQSMSSDADLRKVADFVSRAANLRIRSGSQTVEESNSFSGLGKAFVVGFVNPLMGAEGGMIFLESLFTNFDAIMARLEDRYQPILKRYQFAAGAGSVVFWLMFIGGVVGYLILRDGYEQKLLLNFTKQLDIL